MARRDLFARSKFQPRERRLPGHGCAHPKERLYILGRFDTVLNLNLTKRSCRRSHTHFNRCRQWKVRTRFPGNASEDSNICHVHAQLIHLGDWVHRSKHFAIADTTCCCWSSVSSKNWQSHRLVACSLASGKSPDSYFKYANASCKCKGRAYRPPSLYPVVSYLRIYRAGAYEL